MKMQAPKNDTVILHPDRLGSYFRADALPLFLVTVSGILCNVGMLAGPYFEGLLVQRLYDITQGKKTFSDMVSLALLYVLVILAVQCLRAVKRFYVRRFANDTSYNMRRMIYNSLLYKSKKDLDSEGVGAVMTKAVSDVADCSEGMRKFTTELFDTGIALISYLVMLFAYDVRLTLLSCLFLPLAYLLAAAMKKPVFRFNAAYKRSAENLNGATMDRLTNALSYRVFGRDESRNKNYETYLQDYEKKAILADLWGGTLQPVYEIISMGGVLFIIYFGARNLTGNGWAAWNLAAFTTYITVFAKMAVKSSHAAKLFNAVQKAQVSWKRIRPLMRDYIDPPQESSLDFSAPLVLSVRQLSFGCGDHVLPDGLSFEAKEGEVIGITGPVASGKSSFGRVFLCEEPYRGSIRISGHELSKLTNYERSRLIAYMGHNPELLGDTIENNITLGGPADVWPYLSAVRLAEEVSAMPLKEKTPIGDGGVRLSGGQKARTALARTLYSGARILILDDPFSAVDKTTEQDIMENLKPMSSTGILLIISHRLDLFPNFSKVIWLDADGSACVSTHRKLMESKEAYRSLYLRQEKGGDLDEA